MLPKTSSKSYVGSNSTSSSSSRTPCRDAPQMSSWNAVSLQRRHICSLSVIRCSTWKYRQRPATTSNKLSTRWLTRCTHKRSAKISQKDGLAAEAVVDLKTGAGATRRITIGTIGSSWNQALVVPPQTRETSTPLQMRCPRACTIGVRKRSAALVETEKPYA